MISAEDLPPMPDGLPIFVMKPPKIHGGDYLATLHQWGELPDVVPIIGATNMLAVLVRQNPAALAKVLRTAVESGELPFWGWNSNRLNHHGNPEPGWTKDMIMWLRVARPIRKVLESGEIRITMEIDDSTGRVHWEATGINPADAVALLVRRGRRVPPELRDFLPTDELASQLTRPFLAEKPSPTEPAPIAGARVLKKKTLVAELRHEWPSIEPDLKEASRNGLKEAAHAGPKGWRVADARAWADNKGKLRKGALAADLATAWPGGRTINKLHR